MVVVVVVVGGGGGGGVGLEIVLPNFSQYHMLSLSIRAEEILIYIPNI